MATRIYSLAKDLGLDNKELVEIVKKAGIAGKGSALASLEDDEVERIRHFMAEGDSQASNEPPPSMSRPEPTDRGNIKVVTTRSSSTTPLARKPAEKETPPDDPAKTVEEVVESPMLSTPIRYLDMCPTSDGSAAVIFTSDPGNRAAAWVKAVASCHNHTYLGDVAEGSVGYRHSLRVAAEKAYKQAGITNPRKQFDVVEMYEPCSWAALDWAESLGLAEPGKASELWKNGAARIDGDIPINPSGGVLCTNPIGGSTTCGTALSPTHWPPTCRPEVSRPTSS